MHDRRSAIRARVGPVASPSAWLGGPPDRRQLLAAGHRDADAQPDHHQARRCGRSARSRRGGYGTNHCRAGRRWLPTRCQDERDDPRESSAPRMSICACTGRWPRRAAGGLGRARPRRTQSSWGWPPDHEPIAMAPAAESPAELRGQRLVMDGPGVPTAWTPRKTRYAAPASLTAVKDLRGPLHHRADAERDGDDLHAQADLVADTVSSAPPPDGKRAADGGRTLGPGIAIRTLTTAANARTP